MNSPFLKVDTLEECIAKGKYPGHGVCQCGQCEDDEYFECSHCGYKMPYCFGADDNRYDLCDFCYAELGIEDTRYDLDVRSKVN